MTHSDLGLATMAISIALLCGLILALVYVPGFAPGEDVLRCDGEGGYWSHAEETCQKSDSPAAGLAA
ncbi:MAG: hypothetical protein AAGH68_16725 [Pseudomonadota bacterium]